MPAYLFGSISTLADTSELQRQAFNDAFREHGLDWEWSRADYAELLTSNGGRQRIEDVAAGRGETVDAAAIHRTKSARFQQALAAADLTPRPGVAETIRAAKAAGAAVGLVTTTATENVEALIAALGPGLVRADFDVITDAGSVGDPKPDPAAYAFALDALQQAAADCVAIEDNVGGVTAARAAGLVCVAFPNENTAGHDFGAATRQVVRLDPDELRDLIPAG